MVELVGSNRPLIATLAFWLQRNLDLMLSASVSPLVSLVMVASHFFDQWLSVLTSGTTSLLPESFTRRSIIGSTLYRAGISGVAAGGGGVGSLAMVGVRAFDPDAATTRSLLSLLVRLISPS